MEADISPQASLNAKDGKANSINNQYNREASQEQPCMVWGNVSFESKSEGCHIRHPNQSKLRADDKD
jgi:hypothetical protein